MNKVFFITLLFCCFNIVFAQSDDPLKPSKGSVTAELNFNPFKGELSLNNSINQIRGRYFIQNDLALRLGLGLNVIDTSGTSGDPYGSNSNYREVSFKSTAIDLNVGIEKHFFGTRRLSPFIGLELTYGTKSSKYHESTSDYDLRVSNGVIQSQGYFMNGIWYSSTDLIHQGYNRFGVSAIAGFDFYVSKNFYIGYEFNLNYSNTKYKSPDITATGNYQVSNNYYGSSSFSKFGITLINGVRVGFAF